ncbi:UDP-N-acetylmuramate dehydrogenase [Naumannella cuiyingiana]|uniref:UDP-N-acetylenolpyruvoylglucosamine reductase n=1 Tax=Naumannella cuiyingiana TaxID=1347891 RepID=A0A7Z0D861_9ACTN|nr:UDP-N-acetylmuramate dehydrogenase [Naumannella cuiyingiana]NYI70539.1 UDP-N-acetylmuramate dehydrogenase [Naumannella cuiyingiana]
MTDLAELTTLRVGGPARELATARSADELVALITEADEQGTPVLLIGGGSNLLIADAGFDGRVIVIANRRIDSDVDSCSGAMITAQAGEPWDAFVAHTLEHGWAGLEALSGIPGLVGATPIQNVGAYGAEVAQTIARVRTWDRAERRIVTFAGADCGFSYRHSRFKGNPDRFVVLDVTFQLPIGDLSAPVRYAELARRLGVEQGERAPATRVREAVLALRRGKGMVLDADDHDTWSAGSFFTNPIIDAAAADALPADAPRFPQPDGRVKTSAAWLIDHAGFDKGHGTGAARLSGKHVLALTNRGDARAVDLLALAREIRDGVRERWGITLVNEPVIIGDQL